MRESGLARKLIPSPAADLVMGGTLSLRERDLRKQAVDSSNSLKSKLRLHFSCDFKQEWPLNRAYLDGSKFTVTDSLLPSLMRTAAPCAS